MGTSCAAQVLVVFDWDEAEGPLCAFGPVKAG